MLWKVWKLAAASLAQAWAQIGWLVAAVITGALHAMLRAVCGTALFELNMQGGLNSAAGPYLRTLPLPVR